ncbi:hypothetical protein LUX33_48135 [Actinomadura madurae]|nr:3-oxoacyl-[acyl-carrier-protein] synthase III C-terminal domain-containing protein [Actinomadura madurae]MCP9955359.1 hypothetical protein [Actinomadura madurae]
MLCAEACSAGYVIDGTMRTAVVNSLFGDGAAAVALVAGPSDGADTTAGHASAGPRILGFAATSSATRSARCATTGTTRRASSASTSPRRSRTWSARTPGHVVARLLSGAGLRRSDIGHWLVHSGGKKVIDAVRMNLGLTRHDVRHTTGVLRDYGNLSSGSFLFSYERLLRERVTRPGEYGVLMAMGPGSTIETALVQW